MQPRFNPINGQQINPNKKTEVATNFKKNETPNKQKPITTLEKPQKKEPGDIQATCKLHGSDVGGCCECLDCANKQQIFCIKCTLDSRSCIRTDKHEFLSIEEFISNIIDKEIYKLKNDNQFSKSFSYSTKFLDGEVFLKQEFLEKSRQIQDEVNDYYLNMIEFMKELLEDFNTKFENFVNSKFTSLTSSYNNLHDLTSYDDLCRFNKLDLTCKANSLSYDDLNKLIITTKKTMYNYHKGNCDYDLENIKYISDMSITNENIFMVKKRFEEIKHDLETKHLSFCNNIEKNILTKTINNKISLNSTLNTKNDINREEGTGLSSLVLFKDFHIDYSRDSNFIDKTFTIFEHSNGMSLFGFPTSQNTIKLINFEDVLSDEKLSPEENEEIIKSNSNDKERGPNSKFGYQKGKYLTLTDVNRPELVDRHLYYKLMSHGGRITILKYYRLCLSVDEQKDILITGSEDKTIKIWDISSLDKSEKDVNYQYKNHCVRTILAHDGNKISSIFNFYDPLKNKNFIVSSGFGDRIKVWDMASGNISRDMIDSIKNPNFDNEINIFHENFSGKNFMLTAGHNSQVRIWDFDSGRILRAFQNKEKVIQILFFSDCKNLNIINSNSCTIKNITKFYDLNNTHYLKQEQNTSYSLPKFFIIDEAGKCGIFYLEKNDNDELLFNLKPERVNFGSAYKKGAIKWSDNKIFIYCNNGQIYEYESEEAFENFLTSGTDNKNFLNGYGNNVNNQDQNQNNIKKGSIFVSLGTLPISHGLKMRNIKYGDILIMHSHDQKIKIFKFK
jgi:hypothetical protein